MRFRIGDVELTASISEVGERALTIQFRAPKLELHEQLLAAAQQRAGVTSLDDDKEWRIADVSFGYVGSEPWGMHHHTWRLEQVTRVAVGPLRLGDGELQPYDYREETTPDGMLRFALRAAADDSQLRALAQLSGVIVDVQRSDDAQPRRMLLEGFVWGASTAHGQAVALVCTEQVEPRVTLAGASTPDLLGALLRKGLLGPDDVMELRRVQDVDAWEL